MAGRRGVRRRVRRWPSRCSCHGSPSPTSRAYLAVGDAFWEPGWLLVIATGLALVCTLVSAPSRLAQVAGWGGVLTAVGVLVARTGSYGAGTHRSSWPAWRWPRSGSPSWPG